MEEIENKLCLEHGSCVTLIRPGFGSQSESMVGIISAFTDKYPITFQVSSMNQNVIFTIDDVTSVEKPHVVLIITLKGPKDYITA